MSTWVTLLTTPLVTHLEKVRFLIPLRGLNVRHFFSRSGYSIGRICWRYDISTIWSLHNIFPKIFSFLLRSRKDKNKTRTQSRQTVIHYSPTGKPSWQICSHPLLFLGLTATMWGIRYCYTCARLSLALIFQAWLLMTTSKDSQQIPRTNHITVFWDHRLNTLRNYPLVFSPQSPLTHSIWTWCANWYPTELYAYTKHYLLCSLCIRQIYSYFTNIIIILMIIAFHSMPYTATSISLIASIPS